MRHKIIACLLSSLTLNIAIGTQSFASTATCEAVFNGSSSTPQEIFNAFKRKMNFTADEFEFHKLRLSQQMAYYMGIHPKELSDLKDELRFAKSPERRTKIENSINSINQQIETNTALVMDIWTRNSTLEPDFMALSKDLITVHWSLTREVVEMTETNTSSRNLNIKMEDDFKMLQLIKKAKQPLATLRQDFARFTAQTYKSNPELLKVSDDQAHIQILQLYIQSLHQRIPREF